MASPPFRQTEDPLWNDIILRSRRLSNPPSYWKGLPELPPLLPRNILLFRRLDARYLTRKPTMRHQHHRHLLIASLRGAGIVGADAQMHRLEEGHCLLIFPFQSHCFIDVCPRAIHWIFATFEQTQDPRLEPLRERGAQPMTPKDLTAARNLLQAWQSLEEHDTLPLHLALWLHQMGRAVARLPKAVPRRRETGGPDDPGDLVRRVNSHVFANRHQPLPLEGLARHLGISASSLRSRFRAATGHSLGRHIREIKLNHACELLHDTRLRIEEISQRCGYDSLFAFSRAFRTAHGCSPTRYRSAHHDPDFSTAAI